MALALTVALATTALGVGAVPTASVMAQETPYQPISIPFGEEVLFGAGVLPKRLSARSPQPVRFGLTVEERSVLAPSGFRSLELDFDRHLAFDGAALPSCDPGRDPARAVREARCHGALLATGRARVRLFDPEDVGGSTPVEGELALFNGGSRGNARVARLDLTLPAPIGETIGSSVLFRKGAAYPLGGRNVFASRADVSIPKIDGGQAELTSLSLAFRASERVEGRSLPVFTATCPAGELRFAGTAKLVDGVTADSELVRACTPTR